MRAAFLGGALLAGLLAGCGTISKTVDKLEKVAELEQVAGVYPKNATVIPDVNVGLSPNNVIPLEKLALTAAGAALLYYVYDPLAPNWELTEARLADDTYRLSMKLKRFHTGGAGEAMMIFKRRARQLQSEQGYVDYQIVEFSEGIESSTPVAQRYSEGVLRLVKASSSPRP